MATAVLLFAAVLPVSAQKPATTVVSNQQIPQDLIQTAPCLGQIHVKYILHIVSETTVDANGTHAIFHFNIHDFEGVVLATGVSFSGSQAFTSVLNSSAAPPLEVIQTMTLTGETRGSTDNLLIRVRIRTIINANGDTTSQIDSVSMECKG